MTPEQYQAQLDYLINQDSTKQINKRYYLQSLITLITQIARHIDEAGDAESFYAYKKVLDRASEKQGEVRDTLFKEAWEAREDYQRAAKGH